MQQEMWISDKITISEPCLSSREWYEGHMLPAYLSEIPFCARKSFKFSIHPGQLSITAAQTGIANILPMNTILPRPVNSMF